MGISPRKKPVNLLIIAAVALVAIVAALIYFFGDSLIPVERRNDKILHEAYVWQRQWDATVAEALDGAASQMAGFTALAAEVSFKSGAVDKVVRVRLDYDALKSTGKPVGLALRIGSYRGPFDEESEATRLLAELAGSVVAEAREAGLKPVELQIDYDCAESKLRGYQKWVEVLAREIRPVPVVITALPSWLKRRAFTHLARACDGFVLQVHSLERPKGPNEAITLCDSAAAVRWVEKAARTGVRFRVALPTYGYVVAFDEEGEYVGISAEGPSRNWGEGTVLRIVRSDPAAMAKLVSAWENGRPADMQGIIWYRLPVATDRLNWKPVTLQAVMDKRTAYAEPSVRIEFPEEPKRELVELVLGNCGNADLSPRIRIDIECDRGRLLACDGLRGFTLSEAGPSGMCLEYRETEPLAALAPGERWKVGWLRFKESTPISVNASILEQ